MITDKLLSKVATYIQSQIAKCQYILGSETKDISIHSKEVSDGVVKVSILLDENIKGTITEFKFLDTDGQVVKKESCNIVKGSGRGLLKVFKISISEVI